MKGESLHVTGRLLDHRHATTTNRYAHLDDATLSAAAERVAGAIERKLFPYGDGNGRREIDMVQNITLFARDRRQPMLAADGIYTEIQPKMTGLKEGRQG